MVLAGIEGFLKKIVSLGVFILRVNHRDLNSKASPRMSERHVSINMQ